MIYHLLDKPLRVMADKRVEWQCLCGLRVALPPQQVPRLTPIQTADAKGSNDPIECVGCYADEAAPSIADDAATLDADLGAEDDDQAPMQEDDDGLVVAEDQGTDDGTVVREEREDFPT